MSEVAGRMAEQAGAAHLKNGLNLAGGPVTYEAVAQALGYPFVNADSLLA